MKVYKIRPDGGNPCCESDIEALKVWFEESQVGDNFIIHVLEMTEDEYMNLPEYMGP